MKLLAIDIGNTTVNFGLFKKDKLAGKIKIYSKDMPHRQIPYSGFENAVIASVVPWLTKVVSEKIKRMPGKIKVTVLDYTNIPMPLKVDFPSQVGADRIVNAFAAAEIYGCPAVVIDMGTATTFDIVSENCEYAGGVIAPGLRMSLDSLHEKTSKLPRVELKIPNSVVGKNTEDAINSGIIFGNVGMIKEVMERIGSRKPGTGEKKAKGARCRGIGKKPTVVLTGGYSEIFAKYFPAFEADPDMTLKGLKIIHKKLFKNL